MLQRPRIIRLSIAGMLLATTMFFAAPSAPARARCTLRGTSGDDHLIDTAGASRICALGGNDIVEAGPQNDVVLGGKGGDSLEGNEGKDLLKGHLLHRSRRSNPKLRDEDHRRVVGMPDGWIAVPMARPFSLPRKSADKQGRMRSPRSKNTWRWRRSVPAPSSTTDRRALPNVR
jgi:hypothetical protein